MLGDSFEIISGEISHRVERLKLPGHSAFRILFSDNRKPLVIARASNAEASKFWTSIPEGRQAEAEVVGTLIENYLNK